MNVEMMLILMSLTAFIGGIMTYTVIRTVTRIVSLYKMKRQYIRLMKMQNMGRG